MLRITIITVCYNEKNEVEKTIKSVCGQTYPNIEYLIIDGASTDGTLDVLKKYSDNECLNFYSEKDYGVYNAMNRGIARASGEYIFFLNAGDIFYNEYAIEEVASYIKENSDIIYFGKTCRVYADGSKQIQDYEMSKGTLKEKLLHGYMPCHQSIFAPRELLINHYFREQFEIRADYEWLIYCVSKGYGCKGIPVIIAYYDMTGISGRIKNINQQLEEEQLILCEYQQQLTQDVSALCQKKKVEREITEQKYFYLFRLMNYWLTLRQRNASIGMYLRDRGCQCVAIYGMGNMGLRLVDELVDSGIEIKYVVDQNADNICTDLRICSPDAVLENVDMMIVTAVLYYKDIKEKIGKKITSPIVSLEDLIYKVISKLDGMEKANIK